MKTAKEWVREEDAAAKLEKVATPVEEAKEDAPEEEKVNEAAAKETEDEWRRKMLECEDELGSQAESVQRKAEEDVEMKLKMTEREAELREQAEAAKEKETYVHTAPVYN